MLRHRARRSPAPAQQLRRVRPPLQGWIFGAARVAGLAGDARHFLLTDTAAERAARLHVLALHRENDLLVYHERRARVDGRRGYYLFAVRARGYFAAREDGHVWWWESLLVPLLCLAMS